MKAGDYVSVKLWPVIRGPLPGPQTVDVEQPWHDTESSSATYHMDCAGHAPGPAWWAAISNCLSCSMASLNHLLFYTEFKLGDRLWRLMMVGSGNKELDLRIMKWK
jgi:hypothetical protein